MLFVAYFVLCCFNGGKAVLIKTDLDVYWTWFNLVELVVKTGIVQVPVLCLVIVHVSHMKKSNITEEKENKTDQ